MAEYEIDLKWLLDKMEQRLDDIESCETPRGVWDSVDALRDDIALLRQYQDVNGLPGPTATKEYE